MKLPFELTYVGTDDDYCGGMTPTGTLERDAQVFDFAAGIETCIGWDYAFHEEFYDKGAVSRYPDGHLVNQLSPELRECHDCIFCAAIGHAQAKVLVWVPELGVDEA